MSGIPLSTNLLTGDPSMLIYHRRYLGWTRLVDPDQMIDIRNYSTLLQLRLERRASIFYPCLESLDDSCVSIRRVLGKFKQTDDELHTPHVGVVDSVWVEYAGERISQILKAPEARDHQCDLIVCWVVVSSRPWRSLLVGTWTGLCLSMALLVYQSVTSLSNNANKNRSVTSMAGHCTPCQNF